MKRLTDLRVNRGFSLLDALVALLIVGFGMLAIAKLQITFGTNSDLAKQRSEATRLAQEKIEELRSFEQLNSQSGKVAYADVVSGSDSVSSVTVGESTVNLNATYARAWTIADSANAAYKTLSMAVSWTDREGASRSVDFRTTIAKLDPKTAGGLKFPPAGSPVKKPKDRSLNVPTPAVSLQGGKSGFTPPGASGYYYAFDNNTGMVTNLCNSNLPTAGSAACNDNTTTAFIISGYVNFSTGNSPCSSFGTGGCNQDARLDLSMVVTPKCPDGTNPGGGSCSYPNLPNLASSYQCTDDGAIATKTGTYSQSGTTLTLNVATHGLSTGMQIYLNFTSGDAQGFDGTYAVVTVVNANSFTVTANNSQSANGNVRMLDPYTTAYTCVVTAYDRGSGTDPRYVWAGTVRLGNSIGVGVIGTTSSDYKVCRYSADYDSDGAVENSEHPSTYGLTGSGNPGYMSESLENQNYLVVMGNKACPTDTGYVTIQLQP